MRKILVIISFVSVLFSCENEEDIPQFIQAEIVSFNLDNLYLVGDTIEITINYLKKSDCYIFSSIKTQKLDNNKYSFEVWLEYNNNECTKNIITDSIKTFITTDINGSYHFIFSNKNNYLEKTVYVQYHEIEHEFTQVDYQYIIDTVQNDPEKNIYVDSYGKTEFYYGACSQYSNFELRISKRRLYDFPCYSGLSDDEIYELMWERVPEALILFLKHKFPDSNIYDRITLIFKTFDDTYVTNYYNITYNCTDKTPNLSFEIVDGFNLQ